MNHYKQITIISRKVLLLIFLVCVTFLVKFDKTLFAQDKLALSLVDCYKLAIEKNPELKVNEYRVKVNQAGIKSAEGLYLPAVNANIGYSRQLTNIQAYIIDGRLITQPNNFSLNTGISLSLYDGFARENNIIRANNELSITELNNQRTIEQIKYNIFKAYLSIIQSKKVMEIRQQNLQMGKSDLDKINAMYEMGVLTIDNVYSQEAEVGSRELDFIRAENDYNLAQTNLFKVIGVDPLLGLKIDENSIKTEITDKTIEDFKNNYNNIDNDVKIALESRNDYLANKKSIESINSAIEIAYAAYMPSLSANAGWSWVNSQISDFSNRSQATASINLNIPIFDRFQNNSNIEQQKLQLEITELAIFQAEQLIKSTLYANLQNLTAAEKQIKITGKSLKSAELNYQSTKVRYEAGALNINDVTIANSQYVNAQINQVNAYYNYIGAEKDILFTLGKFED